LGLYMNDCSEYLINRGTMEAAEIVRHWFGKDPVTAT